MLTRPLVLFLVKLRFQALREFSAWQERWLAQTDAAYRNV